MKENLNHHMHGYGWSVLEQGKVIIYMNSTRKSIAEQDYMHELPGGINAGIIIYMNFEKEVALEQGRSSYIYEYKEKINTRIRLYAWTSRGINAGIIIHMNSEKEVGLEQGRSSYYMYSKRIQYQNIMYMNSKDQYRNVIIYEIKTS